MQNGAMMDSIWDREADVVVVGYGLAGATAAIAAHDAGAKVILIEKLPDAGGNSILSGGVVTWSTNVEDAAKYLHACSGDMVDRAMIEFMAQGMLGLPDYVNRLADAAGADTAISEVPGIQYPFPGKESFKTIRVLGFKDREKPRPSGPATGMWITSALYVRGGAILMNMMFRLVDQRGVTVMSSTPAKRLVQNSKGRVVGLLAESGGRELAIKANKAVILACGGFEFNDWLKKQYFEIQPLYGAGCRGNTGDGVLMSQKAGAALWHMWRFHGAYGFKLPQFDYAFRVNLIGILNPKEPPKVVWVLVNKDGKRFMSEVIPFVQASSYLGMQVLNTDFFSTRSGVPEFSNIPCYMIFDEEGRKRGPIGWPVANPEKDKYEWSRDNTAEIEKGWIKRADTVQGLAASIGVSPAELEQTLRRWNDQCAEGKDTDFSRHPGSMVPIKSPPFYAIESLPVVSFTLGGPQFNSRCQVIDPFGEPIPGLYKAGELGSFFGHLYAQGAGLSECIIEGRTAGENAARE